MKCIIGSGSKRKIDSAAKVIKQLYHDRNITVEGYAAKSGVPETPWDRETFDGARNRAMDAREHIQGADYYIGLESGLIERYGHIYEEAWAVVITKDSKEYYGYSSGLKVPDFILKKMDDLDLEHCDAMTIIEEEFGKLPSDTWGVYSGGALLREVSLEESLRNALIQLAAPEASFYKK